MRREPDRRGFLQVASTGVLAATALRSSSAVGNGPNDKLTVGLIGCGGRGTHDARLCQGNPNVEVAYVSDPDERRLASAAKSFNVPSSMMTTRSSRTHSR